MPTGTPHTTYLEAHDAAELRVRAKVNDRSLAAEIRRAVRLYLDGHSSNSEGAPTGSSAEDRADGRDNALTA